MNQKVERLIKLLNKIKMGVMDKETIISFLMALSEVTPPGEDYAVEIGGSLPHVYMVDSKGALLFSSKAEEFLPYFSGSTRRISLLMIPDEIIINVPSKIKDIIDQLRKQVEEWIRGSRGDEEYYKIAKEIIEVCEKSMD